MWPKNKVNGDQWSPYGHEPARRRVLKERRVYLILAALGIALLYALFLGLTLSEETGTTTGSQSIETQEQKPVTVAVTPGGRPAFMNPQVKAPDGRNAPGAAVEEKNRFFEFIKPFLSLLAPLAAALWLLSRVGSSARGKLAELNFGIYKGAMPYEMHTSRAFARVFTHREVGPHVFGKAREDFLWGTYLSSPPIAVRRLLGEVDIDDARIVQVHKGGARRVTVTAPAAAPATLVAKARERALDALDVVRDTLGLRRGKAAYRRALEARNGK